MKLSISPLLILFFAVGVFAQKESVTVETNFLSISPNADKLPLPEYPKNALKAGLGGPVFVEITLDEKGKVTADNATGPYPICPSVTDSRVIALRNSALEAAKRSHFQLVDGTGGMRGRIIYDFHIDPEKVEPSKEMRLDRLTKLGAADDTIGARVVDDGNPGETKNPDSTPHKIVSGGVLNGKALALPKPTYSPAARAVRAGGQVPVQVLIVEDGTVYSAQAVSGNPLLRAGSEVSACSSKFSPTLLEGHPVKVSGIITYNYVP